MTDIERFHDGTPVDYTDGWSDGYGEGWSDGHNGRPQKTEPPETPKGWSNYWAKGWKKGYAVGYEDGKNYVYIPDEDEDDDF